MKRNYSAPKVEIVTFDFNDQVVVASGALGTYGSGVGMDRCQQSTTSCTLYYYSGLCEKEVLNK